MEELRKNVKKTMIIFIIIIIIIIFVLLWMKILNHVKNKNYYDASDFGIKTIYSSVDYNKNGLDDYSDFVLGARDNNKDAVLSAFKNAGYNLDIVSDDLIGFFVKYAQILTLDKTKISEWQPGDIVFWENESGIISDKRNKDGIPFIIYSEGEKNDLEGLNIKFHFRFDGEQINLDLLD